MNRYQLKSEPLTIEFFQVGLTIKEEQDDSVAQAADRRPSQSAVQGILPGIAGESGGSRNLGIGKTRFFALLREYRQHPEAFSTAYERPTPCRLTAAVEGEIDREVLTASTGALVQHDSSLHLWSPFAQQKWVLITSIDDFSRMLLFADFAPRDTTWAHIQAAQGLMQSYGITLRYYVDSLRVFRFVQGRDSV